MSEYAEQLDIGDEDAARLSTTRYDIYFISQMRYSLITAPSPITASAFLPQCHQYAGFGEIIKMR